MEDAAQAPSHNHSLLFDGFVKSPSAALPPCSARRQALHPQCHCGVQVSTPHSVGFERLASEAFYCAV